MILSLFSLIGIALAQDCVEISGNWYCDPTSEVIYHGLGSTPGSYQRVTDMDPDACTCTQATQAFSGPLSPLDEDLSFHFRGPITIAQFAAYTMTTGTVSSKRKRSLKSTRKRKQEEPQYNQKRDQAVYTLIPPIYTEYDVETTTSASVSVAQTVTQAAPKSALSTIGTLIGLPSQLSTAITYTTTSSSNTPVEVLTTSTTSVAPVQTDSTIWSRGSYYNAAQGVLDNAVFLNNMGGVNGSGTWSTCFGNSLSYASESGTGAAAVPQTLAPVTLPSDVEVSIWSSTPCTPSTCGYVSDGVPGYLGFGGADKMFLFEFGMPSDAASIGSANGDMPAIWALNAQIPRSQQYGGCSCWQTGCGELDLFEVLSGGSDYLTTTFHSVLGGGGATSNYFERPTSGTLKAAVVFISATKEIQIIELDADVEFDENLAYDVFEDWQQASVSNVNVTLS